MPQVNRAGNPSGLRDRLVGFTAGQAADLFATFSADELLALRHDWEGVWARPEQLPPDDGEWTTFLYLAGRGAGKTRAAAEWIRRVAREHPGCRVAIVARTAADARDVCIEGESGLLAVHPPAERPRYEPSKRRVEWSNGSLGTVYSADEPDLLRGPQHHFAWVDELATWQRGEETFSNLRLGLRLGAHPRCMVTTTPRPLHLLRELLASPTTIVRRGSTFDNAANLAPSALAEFRTRYEGTRLGRQELYGELLEQAEGALWSHELLDRTRVASAPADLERIVVGVDPATTSGPDSDLTGIVTVGRGRDGHLYVLRDDSLRASPAGWASKVATIFDATGADRVVIERNNGGDMCEQTLRSVRPHLPITTVVASRGKITRAEPIAARFEQARAHVVGVIRELEDELVTFAPGAMAHSPDRADAMCWAATELTERAPATFALIPPRQVPLQPRRDPSMRAPADLVVPARRV